MLVLRPAADDFAIFLYIDWIQSLSQDPRKHQRWEAFQKPLTVFSLELLLQSSLHLRYLHGSLICLSLKCVSIRIVDCIFTYLHHTWWYEDQIKFCSLECFTDSRYLKTAAQKFSIVFDKDIQWSLLLGTLNTVTPKLF